MTDYNDMTLACNRLLFCCEALSFSFNRSSFLILFSGLDSCSDCTEFEGSGIAVSSTVLSLDAGAFFYYLSMEDKRNAISNTF